MPEAAIRTTIVAELDQVPNLGGAEQRIHKFGFETDDVTEAKAYWQSTEGPTPGVGPQIINAAMLFGTGREDVEVVAGKEFAVIHSFRLLFRFGRSMDPTTEEDFQVIFQAIMDKFKGSKVIFKIEGFEPQPQRDQVARATIVNKKIFGIRVWEADITFDVVERFFTVP